jgi:hypothetical protein
MATDSSRVIEKYIVAYFGGADRSKRPFKYRSIISLYDDTGLFAALYFYDSPDHLPDSDELY